MSAPSEQLAGHRTAVLAEGYREPATPSEQMAGRHPGRLTANGGLSTWAGRCAPVAVAIGLGILVLMVGGLSPRSALVILAGLLVVMGALFVAAPRRLLEIGLMLSFGLTLDVHLYGRPHVVDPSGFPISLTGLVISILAAWWFIERIGEHSRQPLWGGLGLPILGLWMTSVCSALVAPEPQFSLYALINLGYFTLLFLYLANAVTTSDHLRWLVGWLMLAVGITSLAAVGQYIFGHAEALSTLGMLGTEYAETLVSRTDVLRVGGLMGSSNALAWTLVQILPLMLALFLSPSSGFRRPLLIVGLGIGVVALIVTYSRGGWLAFGLTLLLVLPLMTLSQIGGPSKGGWRNIVILGVALTLLAAPLSENVYTRLTEDDRGSAYSRLPMMRVALRMIADHVWFGVGLGNYENVMDRYDEAPERAHQKFPWPVHNIFLNITAEIGVVGGLCFLLVCGLALRQGVQAMRAPDPFLRAAAVGLVVGLIGFLIVGLKELGPLGSSRYRHFWLSVGLLVALRRLSDRAQQTQTQLRST